jgi:hypothetical protein
MTIGGATFLLIVASLVVAGIALLCLRKVPGACAAIGAAVGVFACLFLFQFRAAITSFGADVLFKPLWQRGGNPLLHFGDEGTAETVANLLNCGLGLVGGLVGTAVGLGAGRWVTKRWFSANPSAAADRPPPPSLADWVRALIRLLRP